MKANYEDKISKTTSEVSLGNLYDINKQLMENEAAISMNVLKEKKESLHQWFKDNFNQKYFMLLCHELRDYTVFNLDKTSTWKAAQYNALANASADVIECMTNRGTLLTLTLQDNNTWELWIRNSEGCFAYYLFPYGEAVLEY